MLFCRTPSLAAALITNIDDVISWLYHIKDALESLGTLDILSLLQSSLEQSSESSANHSSGNSPSKSEVKCPLQGQPFKVGEKVIITNNVRHNGKVSSDPKDYRGKVEKITPCFIHIHNQNHEVI